jgi:hypothetical protein
MKSMTQSNFSFAWNSLCKILWLIILWILFSADLRAQTFVSGNISGIWPPSGNPYIASANCTVPAGQTLTLQSGVVFLIGSNLTVTASNSLIHAVGTPNQRITISAASSTYYYNTISLTDPPGTNQFFYCDFANAQTAISMNAIAPQSINQYLFDEIMNCTFSNCVLQAIYGSAQGTAGGDASVNPPNSWSESATLSPIIKNCIFSGVSNGCVLSIYGQHSQNIYWNLTGYGYANPTIVANIFQNLAGTALLMETNNYPGGGSPVFVNNTIVKSTGGVNAVDPWNATVQGNIFMGVTNAVTDSGSLMRTVSYNAFYGGATNFTGYSSIYGQVVFNNRNGTPCDLLFNIYQNPLFAAATNFYLVTNSPCINAGPPGQAFQNMCFPPSIGTAYNDMGAYGGPDACNWLNVVPLVQVQPSLSTANNLFLLNWYAVPRSTYQIQYVTNQVNGSNYWQNLPNGQTEALGTPWSLSVAPYPPTNRMQFYRIQSLGRTPGN